MARTLGYRLGHRRDRAPAGADWWPSRDDTDPTPQRRAWRGLRWDGWPDRNPAKED